MDHEVFAFFTTTPNDVVGAIHDKAMLVILRTEEEWKVWLEAPWSEAQELQRPLPNGVLQVVDRLPLKFAPRLSETPSRVTRCGCRWERRRNQPFSSDCPTFRRCRENSSALARKFAD